MKVVPASRWHSGGAPWCESEFPVFAGEARVWPGGHDEAVVAQDVVGHFGKANDGGGGLRQVRSVKTVLAS